LHLQHPLQFEIFYIVSGDLAERAVAVAVVIARIREPVLRFACGFADALRGDLRLCQAGSKNNKKEYSFHHD